MKNNKFYLEALPLLIFLGITRVVTPGSYLILFFVSMPFLMVLIATSACSVEEVEDISTARRDTCHKALECSVNCEVPTDDLGDLGCAPGDFYSTPPQCEMKNNCGEAKSECYEICDEQTETHEEELDCKIECSEQYGSNSICEENFLRWVDDRQSILSDYNNCVRPCALGVTLSYCLENPGACSEEQHAALMAIEKVTLCQMGDSEACGFTCESLVNNFYCH